MVGINVANASSIMGAGGLGGSFNFNCTPQGYRLIILNIGGGTLTPAGGADAIIVQNGLFGGGVGQPSLHITNGTIVCSGSGAGLHVISGTAVLYTALGQVTFGTCTSGLHIFADGNGARIFLDTGYTISGNAAFHYSAVAGGLIDFNTTATITCTGSPAFTTFANAGGAAAASALWLGQIYVPSAKITYSGCGTVTGKRYNAQLNSVINSAGGGANFFPGNAAGTVATGGQYN